MANTTNAPVAQPWAPETNPGGERPWSDDQVKTSPAYQYLSSPLAPFAGQFTEEELVLRARELLANLFETRAKTMLSSDIEAIRAKLDAANVQYGEKGIIVFLSGAKKGRYQVRGGTPKKTGTAKFKREFYERLIGKDFVVEKTDEKLPAERRGKYVLRVRKHPTEKFMVQIVTPSNSVVAWPPLDPAKKVSGEVEKLGEMISAAGLGQGTLPMVFTGLWDEIHKMDAAAKKDEKNAKPAAEAPKASAPASAVRQLIDEE